MADLFDWKPIPTSGDDERLIDAYSDIGRSIDDLAYTQDFEEICRRVIDGPIDDARRHFVFKRLLGLRKRGQLPRVTSLRRR